MEILLSKKSNKQKNLKNKKVPGNDSILNETIQSSNLWRINVGEIGETIQQNLQDWLLSEWKNIGLLLSAKTQIILSPARAGFGKDHRTSDIFTFFSLFTTKIKK